MVADASPRQPRSHIRQSDIARAIRGALQAGMEVREVIATRDGIRILSAPSDRPSASANSWDEVLDNG
ncbi:MAG: hypothetical protein KJ947_11500 [Alphaproteobacteria bacterium]|nr:hypothetical protein [Alphaproteobacteria bacterium]MBU1550181.1 hypothetical protein [Alphaproteobacteria bacterium]MBU2337898.1 hypothetical protein [Alphaproteobacteria bacterium]MBU2387878.1 hypothetical protein [Alphaproteobacteria bacterium]